MSRLKIAIKDPKLLVFVLILGTIVYLVFKAITSSVFLNKRDRINIVFYGAHTTFYSLGLNDVSYFLGIPSNLEVEVPGGYGYYRIGALGKLISLEKQSDLFRKTFSSATSLFVDLYFYPKTDSIYYNEEIQKKSFPSFLEMFMNRSNANLLDRFLVWLYFVQKSENQYKEVGKIPQNKVQHRALLDREAFFKLYQGYFYKKTHRIIRDRVQILYTNGYKTALLISNMLDGEGIQVADLTETNQSPKRCGVIVNSKDKDSPSAKDMADFFGCTLKKGDTTVSDIILVLGNLEKDWSVE